jgi:hypothetical protein
MGSFLKSKCFSKCILEVTPSACRSLFLIFRLHAQASMFFMYKVGALHLRKHRSVPGAQIGEIFQWPSKGMIHRFQLKTESKLQSFC